VKLTDAGSTPARCNHFLTNNQQPTTMTKSKLKAKPPTQVEPTKPKILIYGPPGVGKTWFSLDFPSCFYIDTEGGAARTHYMDKLAASGGMIMGQEEGSLDFETVIGQLQALATEKHDFKTVVIDSVSKLFNTAISNEAERLMEAGKKDEFGTSKKPAVGYMRRLVNWIQRVDMNVILIAHQKDEWGMDSKSERIQIGHTFDCWDKLEYELDLALHATKQGASRYANVRKSRLIGFPDKDRFDLTYPAFAERYGKEIIEKPVNVITLATPEQVAEITRLCDVVKLPEGETAKWLAKAGASDWSELTQVQATKAIDALKARFAN
jgi:RecA/RadA recombinase